MKYNIIMLSNQPFDHPLKTNKWHVSTRLAGLGHNVIFLDPPTRFNALKLLLTGKLSLKRFFLGSENRTDHLTIFTPVNIFNFKPFSSFNTFLHSLRINRLLSSMKENKTVFWIYHFDFPDLENFLSKVKHDLLIYDVVDENTAFPEYSGKKTINKGIIALIQKLDDTFQVKLNQHGLDGKEWVIYREDWLVKKANLIFASAPGLILKFQKIFDDLKKDKNDLHFVPNPGDYHRFKDAKRLEVASDMESIPRPRILFEGAIDSYKVNIKLVEKCAKFYPNYSFVLIGPEKLSDPDLDLSILKSLKNVYFLGMKQYEITPTYHAGADEYIIPYNLNEYTIGGCFPIKFHNALATGLPTIVTNMPAYKPFANVCYIAKNEDDFVNLIKVGLEEDNDKKIKERQETSKQNTWEMKVENQLKLIYSKLQ